MDSKYLNSWIGSKLVILQRMSVVCIYLLNYLFQCISLSTSGNYSIAQEVLKTALKTKIELFWYMDYESRKFTVILRKIVPQNSKNHENFYLCICDLPDFQTVFFFNFVSAF